MISITDHESIMNTELQKANQSAQEKLETIKLEMEEGMVKSLEEQTKAVQEEFSKQYNDMQLNLNQSHKQAIDQQRQEHNWKIRELSQESQYKIQDQA